jgi:hypothetical protein
MTLLPTKAEADGCLVEPLSPALVLERGVAAFTRSAGLTAHRTIDRYRATFMTALIVILLFAVSVHLPDHGVPVQSVFHRAAR